MIIIALVLSACDLPHRSGTPVPEHPAPQSAAAPERPEPAGESAPETLRIQVPAGFTTARIGMLLEALDVSTAEEFIQAAQTIDLADFPLIAAQVSGPNRFFLLEGYLFPGEYEIYPDESPESIIRRMLARTERNLGEGLRCAIAECPFTADEIMIIASIIQRESLGNDAYKPLVSSVIHNRLNTGMMLQMCKTSFYVRDYIAPFYGGDAARFHAYYNTYLFHGLPAGPICNPGLSAIHAALLPADTDYFFYIWDSENVLHFAATWEEHVANVLKHLY